MDVIAMLIGVFVGVCAGVVVMALLTSGKIADLEHQLWDAKRDPRGSTERISHTWS